MAVYKCTICEYLYDEAAEGKPWEELPDNWVCPVCDSGKDYFTVEGEAAAAPSPKPASEPKPASVEDALAKYRRTSDDRETQMADIHQMAATGHSVIEPMRTSRPVISWDDLLIKGGQLARMPLNVDAEVSTRTVIGPNAAHPLVIDTPLYVSHMSFGALSKEAKIAMARGSAAAGTAMCSGEGGILPESREAAHRYIFEYVPNQYSVTEENLANVDAVEIKIGQSSKPGMGGHLPGKKVTAEIAAVRGFPEGQDIHSPARFPDINNDEELKAKVDWLREATGGKPIGIKLAAGNIEDDLEIALSAGPDFITIDGRPGATGASPRFIKAATSVPTIFALYRARKFLDGWGASGVSLVITGGLRVSSDFARALALGADAVAVATAAMIACGCQQYRVCEAGKCPVGIATQDPVLRARLNIDQAALGLENYFRVCTEELKMFARLTGNDTVAGLTLTDLCTTNSEISDHTAIEHV